MDSNQDGKLQIEELQTHPAFDQNQDGTVSEDEAKFFLHMDEEMTRDDFLATGWTLMKPYVEKSKAAFKHDDAQPADVGAGGDQPVDALVSFPSSRFVRIIQFMPCSPRLTMAKTRKKNTKMSLQKL